MLTTFFFSSLFHKAECFQSGLWMAGKQRPAPAPANIGSFFVPTPPISTSVFDASFRATLSTPFFIMWFLGPICYDVYGRPTRGAATNHYSLTKTRLSMLWEGRSSLLHHQQSQHSGRSLERNDTLTLNSIERPSYHDQAVPFIW